MAQIPDLRAGNPMRLQLRQLQSYVYQPEPLQCRLNRK
jgi:hypothetical protein